MNLDGKTAVIYGAGTIGRAIATAFVEAGAVVHLAARNEGPLREAAERIGARYAVVDALDERQVDEHAAAFDRIDISVNVISDNDVQGTPMHEMSVEDYLSPVVTNVRSKFLTSRAAARHMVRQGGGVILFFGGTSDGSVHRRWHLGGLVAAFDAVEAMRRQLAAELGPQGVRVVTLQTGGIPESIPAGFRDQVEPDIVGQTALGRAATLDDVGRAAVFAASDWGRTITGAQVNITCGAILS
ncbi:3-oxoacyl-ACP reductase [Lentzea guizhouensis]|uniref:3-oxoacyl-ACP reductase n=1 Tax=Lentzea guizhouensis TaxID=1586287 RepID=A0A1B2I0R9_9PSEU|nr:SDR family oxidoreductase [Lentzea guizhouensis]ANZ43588.1 3-oxoacyl-ACP reductase [Lentzea guizhouensis]